MLVSLCTQGPHAFAPFPQHPSHTYMLWENHNLHMFALSCVIKPWINLYSCTLMPLHIAHLLTILMKMVQTPLSYMFLQCFTLCIFTPYYVLQWRIQGWHPRASPPLPVDAPQAAKFFLISCKFWGQLKSRRPHRKIGAPPLEQSWIRHCNSGGWIILLTNNEQQSVLFVVKSLTAISLWVLSAW